MFINGCIFLGRISRTSLLILTSFFLLIGLLLLPSPGLYAAQVTLAWDPETDPNVAGYRVYYGTASRSYQFNNDVGKNTASTVSNLQTGTTYYFAVTAYNATGIESGYSNEVSFAPATCQNNLSPTSQSIGASGGSASTGISTQTGCTWTAVSNAPSWLTIPSTTSGTGSGTVSYSVGANSATTSRTGTMTIGGQTFTVNQAGSVQYSLSISKSGTGTGTVSNSPTGTSFNAGTVVTLTAIPNANSTFAGWNGACSGTTSPCTATMNGNTSVTAAFNLKTYTITASTLDSNGSISPVGAVTVNSGANQSFTITPNSGYQVADVKVDSVSVGAVTSYSFSNITANHTIQPSFKLPAAYMLSVAKSGTGTGTVSNSPTGTSFNAGTVVTLTATPDANSTFGGWSGGACSGTISPCTVTMNGNTTVIATFNPKTYTITASAAANGSISPQGAVTVNSGANQSFTITPNSGYQVADVQVDGNSVGASSSYLFGSVMANHTIQASFKLPSTYTLSVAKSGTGTGTVSNSPVGTSFNAGTVVTLTAAPDASSSFTGWSGGCSGTLPTCTVTMNSATSVTATFSALQSPIINASAGANGSISPSGAVPVNYGASQSFTITPTKGYKIIDVTVDGKSVGPVNNYLFGNVRGNHGIKASFGSLPGNRRGWR